MNPPCQSVLQCPVPTSPGIGFSTETFVAPVFVANATAPSNPPPLGWAFENPTSTQPGESTVSQQDADNQAYNAAIAQAQAGWFSPSEEVAWEEAVEPLTMEFDDDPEWLQPVEPIF